MRTRALALCCCVAGLTLSISAAPVPLVNFSFEQPGTVKIRGWNGETGADIPGWASDIAAVDSGVESDWPGHTDGLWTGFLMNGDPSVWQLTSHMIQPTDLFTLQIDARDNWSAAGAANFRLSLYYDVAGVRTTAASSVISLNTTWAERTLLFDASTLSAAWGNLIGIELMNVTGGAQDSWLGIDNVRLSVVPVPEPSTLGLLGLGVFALALRRQRF